MYSYGFNSYEVVCAIVSSLREVLSPCLVVVGIDITGWEFGVGCLERKLIPTSLEDC